MKSLKNNCRFLTSALIAGTILTCGINAPAAVNANEAPVCDSVICGMPNPIVEYESIQAAEKELGISALKVENPKFKLSRVAVISKRVVELNYVSLEDSKLTITTRAARNEYADCISAEGADVNISGVYGADWYDENIGDVYIRMANLDNNVSVGHWKDDKCSYSVQITNTTPKQFWNLVVPIYQTVFPEI